MPENRFWYLLSKKLSNAADADEAAEYYDLLKAHPEWTAVAEQITQIWTTHKKGKDNYNAELAFEQHLSKLKDNGIFLTELETPVAPPTGGEEGTGRPARKKVKPFLFAGLAVCFLGFFIWWGLQPTPQEAMPAKALSEVSTRAGSKTRVVLPDSSIVWLNAGSRLTYDEQFGRTNRTISLTGEAFFDVRKSKVPFIIIATGVRIKVLGTAFNVRSYPNETTTETTLIRGEVEITLDKRPGELFVLKPKEKLTVSVVPPGKSEKGKGKQEPIAVLSGLRLAADETVLETSWVENKLVFEDEPFERLAYSLERWYNVTIEFQHKQLGKERLSGSFTTETVQEALEALQLTTPFRYTIKGRQIIISQ
jgi:ferric-dicitrate binding protein FerR (iron transport regulator)